MDEINAREIARWRYDSPYDIYNLGDTDEAIQYAIDPQNAFYSMTDEAGYLIGFAASDRMDKSPVVITALKPSISAWASAPT